MKESIARSGGFEINRKKRQKIRIGSGKMVQTIGTAYADFRFEGETAVYQLEFGIIPNCIHDIILGQPFLNSSATLSSIRNFNRRITQRTIAAPAISGHRLLYLGGSSGPQFEGMIMNQPCKGLADTGAKVAVMTASEARHRGLFVSTKSSDRSSLVFADNSRMNTVGTVYNVPWQFGRGPDRSREYALDFHILKTAPHDIILPEHLLYDTRAFSTYSEFLIKHEPKSRSEGQCFAIDRERRRLAKVKGNLEQSTTLKPRLTISRRLYYRRSAVS
jgi:hypothetical protein